MDAAAAAAVTGLAQAIFTFNTPAPPLSPAALGGFEPDAQTKHQCVCVSVSKSSNVAAYENKYINI